MAFMEKNTNAQRVHSTPDIKDVNGKKRHLTDCSVDISGKPADMTTTGRWKATSFLMVGEVLERVAYFGIVANLVTYLTTVLHEGTEVSSTNVFNWGGSAWITPLIGAFVADTFLGRFRTIVVFAVLYLLVLFQLMGMVSLTLSVSLPHLRPPKCHSAATSCQGATSGELTFFYFSLYLIALGLGGVKPNMSTLGADQFDDGVGEERRMKFSFFNWWYHCIEIGALLAQTVMVYIQDNVGWGWGYGIPTAGFIVAFICILSGAQFYRYQPPTGSPLTRMAQVFVAALHNRNLVVSSDKVTLYEVYDDGSLLDPSWQRIQHTQGFFFLDKAAAEKLSVEAEPKKFRKVDTSPWRLCTVTQVEEVKQVLRMLPIWLTMTPLGLLQAQMQTFYTRQGRTMDTHMGPHFQIPPASLQGFLTITILIFIPLYDRLLVPALRRFTGNARGISMLTRLGTGLLLGVLVCIVAAFTEMKRLKVVTEHGLLHQPQKVVPLTIFWLLPQYALFGLMEVFSSVAQMEFFYNQYPYGMRSLGTAFCLASIGIGNFWSTALTKVVVEVTGRSGHQSWIVNNINRCRLDNLYWLTAVLMASNFCAFLICAQFYKYKVESTLQTSESGHLGLKALNAPDGLHKSEHP